MSIRNTKVGAWLTLARVQSAPLTVVSLVLGYGVVTGEVFTTNITPLLVVGALAHLGGYILNDIADLEHDTTAGRDEKPLVSGEIDTRNAIAASIILILLSIIISIYTFPYGAQNVFLLSIVTGVVYNMWSKDIPLSEILLGIWGFTVIMTGAAYAGMVGEGAISLAVMLFLFLIWLSILDGVKEFDNEDETIPYYLGCEVRDNIIFSPSKPFHIASLLMLVSIGLLGGYIASLNDGLFGAIFTSGSAVIFIITGMAAVTEDMMGREHRAMVVVNTLAGVLLVAISLSPSLGVFSSIGIVAATAVWGLGWQKVIFGSPFYFP